MERQIDTEGPKNKSTLAGRGTLHRHLLKRRESSLLSEKGVVNLLRRKEKKEKP